MTQLTAEPTLAEALPADYWVTIPAGPFTMGSDELREDGKPRAAAPEHHVEVAEFRMAKYPVTVAEFRRFVEATGHVTDAEKKGRSWVWIGDPSVVVPDQDYLWKNIDGASWRTPHGPESTLEGKDDHPVTHVSSLDVAAYCAWSGTRLPTEAEWEKATRGTDGRRYAWGDEEPTAEHCNHTMNVADTTPVDAYPQSAGPYGVVDLTGNVWEITASAFHHYPYDASKPGRVIKTKEGEVELGVIRGGSFYNNCDPRGCLAWVRIYNLPDYSCYDMGFRVCAR
ncbi:formylglycine-generating enzyme family protein [Streptomyces sp. NPDC102402]|uniref:formylglycine-generating enzyme family protein n=1 Tax=Streptomyces sp. NPDC102402 TaxID=3366169 RepID=UPI00381DB1E7